MKKKIGYGLLIILIIILAGGFFGIRKFNNTFFKVKPNYLMYSSQSKPIKFDWTSQSFGEYREKQTAIIFPTKIKGVPQQFYMQFDTGSPYSFIYDNTLKSLRLLGIDLKEDVKDGIRYVKQIDFMLDGNLIKASMVRVLPDYGKSFEKNDTISKIGIGTIGSDFIDNRITVIDFKNQSMQILKKRSETMKSLEFKPFDFNARRVMLPVKLDNKDYEFFYDSGCSAFGLITTKGRFNNYTDENIEAVQYGANSWGNSIPIITKPSEKLFEIGNTNLSLKRVSYVDMYTFTQPLITPFTRIGGWLGNQPFNESTLILDTIKEEFTVIK